MIPKFAVQSQKSKNIKNKVLIEYNTTSTMETTKISK